MRTGDGSVAGHVMLLQDRDTCITQAQLLFSTENGTVHHARCQSLVLVYSSLLKAFDGSVPNVLAGCC
jgi:hypothetical protein